MCNEAIQFDDYNWNVQQLLFLLTIFLKICKIGKVLAILLYWVCKNIPIQENLLFDLFATAATCCGGVILNVKDLLWTCVHSVITGRVH